MSVYIKINHCFIALADASNGKGKVVGKTIVYGSKIIYLFADNDFRGHVIHDIYFEPNLATTKNKEK